MASTAPGVFSSSVVVDLPLPFKSQLDMNDADLILGDCGPSQVAMVVQYLRGIRLSVNDVVQRMTGMGLQPDYAFVLDLVKVFRSYGVNCDHFVNISWNTVEADLRAGFPIVALTNYRRLPYTPFNFDGGHYVSLKGIKRREPEGPIIVYMDPYRPPNDGYMGEAWETPARFSDAWSNGIWGTRRWFQNPRQGIRFR